MCNANSTEIPEWINDYQPEEGLDDEEQKLDNKLYNLFKELYAQPDNSTKQKRTINKIWTFLMNNHLLTDLSHQNFRKDSLLEANEIYLKTYEWISEPSIIINSELLTVLNSYCNNNKNEATIKLSTHIFNLNTHKINSKEHKKEQNYIRSCIKELSKKEGNNDFRKESNIYFHQVPRIWLFRPESSRITHHLRSWINQFIKWRIKDLYRHTGKEIIESLDTPQFRDNKSGENRIDYTPDGSQMLAKCPTMQELTNGDLFNTILRNEEKEILLEFITYLKNDPYELLASTHNKTYPQCNCKFLADKRILNDKKGSDSIEAIANSLNMNKSTLDRYINDNFRPLLSSLYVDVINEPELLRKAIREDVRGQLKKKKKGTRHKVFYNAQDLAIKILPLFHEAQTIFSTVVDYLNKEDETLKQKGYKLKTSQIDLCDNAPYEIYFRVAERLKEQGHEITTFEVQHCWETAVLKKFSEELRLQGYGNYKEGNTIINPQYIKKFWDKECRVLLGKLVIDILDI